MKLLRRLSRKSGYTLIEITITIIVVGLISIPLSLLVFQHLESVTQSQDYNMAINLARYEMEVVKNMSYDSILNGSFSNYQGYDYDVTRTVSFVAGNALSQESLKQIVVDVRRSGDPTVLASLRTYLARNVAYGI